jgi:hypothetical protein
MTTRSGTPRWMTTPMKAVMVEVATPAQGTRSSALVIRSGTPRMEEANNVNNGCWSHHRLPATTWACGRVTCMRDMRSRVPCGAWSEGVALDTAMQLQPTCRSPSRGASMGWYRSDDDGGSRLWSNILT